MASLSELAGKQNRIRCILMKKRRYYHTRAEAKNIMIEINC